MRGEVLSSVELVLPSTVVETCYNIKRDAQARFRAVNNEEKTKSDITVEKQADDSVRIQVVVISLTGLTDEEITEELTYDVPDKENTQKPVRKGRQGLRRKAKQNLTKKIKPTTKKKPLNDRPIEESIETVLNDTSLEETYVVDTEEKQIADDLKGEEQKLPVTQSCVHQSEEEEDTVHLSVENKDKPTSSCLRQKSTRGRRGRPVRGRRSAGRNTAKQINNSDEYLHQNNCGSIEEAPKELCKENVKSAPIKQNDLGETEGKLPAEKSTDQESEAALAKESNETKVPVSQTTVGKGRGKKLKRNIEKSDQGKSEFETSSVKINRLRRNVVKQLEKDATQLEECSDKESENKTSQNISEIREDQPNSTKETKKETTRKRKVTANPVESELENSEKEQTEKGSINSAEGAGQSSPDKTESCGVELSDQVADQVKETTPHAILKTKTGKGRSKVKRTNNTKSFAGIEGDTVQHDDVSVQGQVAEVVQTQDSYKGVENVKTSSRAVKRKGRQPKVATPVVNTTIQETATNTIQEPENTEPVPPLPLGRVKTKAQLKQKPSELANYSDNDVESSPAKKIKDTDCPDEEEHCTSPKQPGKKPIQKPKTLARIWRTRKKSGFTHRKKSKPKPSKEIYIDDVGDETSQYSKHENSNVVPDERPEEEASTSHGNLGKESNETEEAVTKEKEKTVPDLVHTQTEEGRKLPQKKRHTAKLAAERQKRAADLHVEPSHRPEEPEEPPSEAVPKESSTALTEKTNTNSNVVSFDVSLDIYNTYTNFNETTAIESLIQLSTARDESVTGSLRGTYPYLTASEPVPIDQLPAPVNGISAVSPPAVQGETEEVQKDGTRTTAQSVSEKETELAIENITELPAPAQGDVIQQLMKIATESKTETPEVSEEPQQNRQGKRAYKREFKVQCRFCQVKVKDYGYLFRHVKKLHREKGAEMKQHLEEIRPLMRTPCPICHKMVSSISNISSHIKQCHATKDSAVLCPICKKTYKTTVSLRQHLRQCHQPQQHRFFCHLCSANFTEKRSLKEHINCSHETTQVFHCDDCGKSFLTKGRLRRHKYIHGDFRHKCNYCGKGFHLKDNMNKHIEIVHEKTQGKRFKCPHCDKKFTVKGNMTQHVMGVHLKQFQYTCPQCQTGFRRKKDMLSHMVKHGDSGPLPDNVMQADHSEDSESSDTNGQSADSPWHGRGEKTEVITGLAEEDGVLPRKTEVIVISPLTAYKSP